MEFKPGIYKVVGYMNDNTDIPYSKRTRYELPSDKYYMIFYKQCSDYIIKQYIKPYNDEYLYRCIEYDSGGQSKIIVFVLRYYSLIDEVLNFKDGLYLLCNTCTFSDYITWFNSPPTNYITNYLTSKWFRYDYPYLYDNEYKYFITQQQNGLCFNLGSTNCGSPRCIKFIDPLQQKIIDKLIDKETVDVNKELLHSKLLEVSEILKTEINSDTDLKPRLETLLDMCLDMVNYV